jgi:hypothetical protein
LTSFLKLNVAAKPRQDLLKLIDAHNDAPALCQRAASLDAGSADLLALANSVSQFDTTFRALILPSPVFACLARGHALISDLLDRKDNLAAVLRAIRDAAELQRVAILDELKSARSKPRKDALKAREAAITNDEALDVAQAEADANADEFSEPFAAALLSASTRYASASALLRRAHQMLSKHGEVWLAHLEASRATAPRAVSIDAHSAFTDSIMAFAESSSMASAPPALPAVPPPIVTPAPPPPSSGTPPPSAAASPASSRLSLLRISRDFVRAALQAQQQGQLISGLPADAPPLDLTVLGRLLLDVVPVVSALYARLLRGAGPWSDAELSAATPLVAAQLHQAVAEDLAAATSPRSAPSILDDVLAMLRELDPPACSRPACPRLAALNSMLCAECKLAKSAAAPPCAPIIDLVADVPADPVVLAQPPATPAPLALAPKALQLGDPELASCRQRRMTFAALLRKLRDLVALGASIPEDVAGSMLGINLFRLPAFDRDLTAAEDDFIDGDDTLGSGNAQSFHNLMLQVSATAKQSADKTKLSYAKFSEHIATSVANARMEHAGDGTSCDSASLFASVAINSFERIAKLALLEFQCQFVMNALPQKTPAAAWDAWLHSIRAVLTQRLSAPSSLNGFSIQSLFTRALGATVDDFTPEQRSKLGLSSAFAAATPHSGPQDRNTNKRKLDRRDDRRDDRHDHRDDRKFEHRPRDAGENRLFVPGAMAMAARNDVRKGGQWHGLELKDNKLYFRDDKYERGDKCAVCGSSGCGDRRMPLKCRQRPRGH